MIFDWLNDLMFMTQTVGYFLNLEIVIISTKEGRDYSVTLFVEALGNFPEHDRLKTHGKENAERRRRFADHALAEK